MNLTDELAIEAEESCGIPAPEECARRPGLRGTPLLLADGRVWLLADYMPVMAPCFDRIYDGNVMYSEYQLEDIQLAASHLLRENYDLRPEAIAALIVDTPSNDLVRSVEAAMFGPKDTHVTWSEWALGSLYSNGIDPASVPPERLLGVLNILVATRRTIPPGSYVSSAVAAQRFSMARARARQPEPPSPAPTPESTA